MLGNTLVGRYQITNYLGGGGFGETYVANDTQLPGSPQCVVKKLKPQSTDIATLEIARRLFDTEAQVLYKLGNHDRIPQLLAYFEENAEFYLVQELIIGNDLSQELKSGVIFTQNQVISLLQEILVWYNLGNTQYNLQKYQEAIASYNKAIRYQPNHYQSWYSKGNALLNLQQYTQAIASYDKAIEYKPDYQQAIESRTKAQNTPKFPINF